MEMNISATPHEAAITGGRSWDAADFMKYRDETEAVKSLMEAVPFSPDERARIRSGAAQLVVAARKHGKHQGVVESFLQEFSLTTAEGLALMGLAEALLRTPDAATKSQLICEKICGADWAAHTGQSGSSLVNASSWALMLTAKWGELALSGDPSGLLRRLGLRVGEPVVRSAVAQAIRIMSGQFVLGSDIIVALQRARRENLFCSFDMLGEGARTWEDATRYEAAYENAIQALALANTRRDGPEKAHGISIKLSALSPRYEATQEDDVWKNLYPRVARLAVLAADAGINFTLDAEEVDRLVISLKLLDRLAREQALGNWTGLGLAVQAYQKRARAVIDGVTALAMQTGRRLMVRLVKGAYWDSEIKRAQIIGMADYPVYTTKPATDLSYLVCAQKIVDAHPYLYGQFATHNAHTLVAVKTMAERAGIVVEFQRLHGMGEVLYAAASKSQGIAKPRTYAPVGRHKDLLPYLVRRLLENGANTGFVHLLLDESSDPSSVAADPIGLVETGGARHLRIPLPINLYGDRRNSMGLNFSEALPRELFASSLDVISRQQNLALPIVRGKSEAELQVTAVRNPYDASNVLGRTAEASHRQIDVAFEVAGAAQRLWDGKGGEERAGVLRGIADKLESNILRLAALCVLEAGKVWADAIAEVREAVDFCRYYALLAEREFGRGRVLAGPTGETNMLELHGRGVFVCISPWNFPLAIFVGQVTAALAAGNAVLAKPAEQTNLIAAEAVRLMHQSGLDPDLLHLLPGRGETVGAALVAHRNTAGVAFTGGTDTAKSINRTLAAKPGAIVPLIAETGGLNAMFVDTSAQREQVIDDVIISAFGSAGQRCSALRLLFLPEETADLLIEGIAGAMDTLVIGDPRHCSTDIGPVIDVAAKNTLLRHMASLRNGGGRVLKECRLSGKSPLLFAPAMVEIGIDQLPDREVFGPILHVVRYRASDLEKAAKALAAKGYGLTLGIHSRLEGFARKIRSLVKAGNIYINRSMIGAVVGVQPFGGEGLSGTGPKAGGPFAIYRYATERAISTNIAAQGGDPALLNL